jgi:hypothetical protein
MGAKSSAKFVDDRAEPLQWDALAAVLTQVTKLDELAPRHDLVAAVVSPNDRSVCDPSAHVAVQPRTRSRGPQSEQSGCFGDAVDRPLKDRCSDRSHVGIMPLRSRSSRFIAARTPGPQRPGCRQAP